MGRERGNLAGVVDFALPELRIGISPTSCCPVVFMPENLPINARRNPRSKEVAHFYLIHRSSSITILKSSKGDGARGASKKS